MKHFRRHVALGLLLLVVSALIYAFQIWSFHRNDETFFYMLQDFAFLPVQVLLVTLVINEMLAIREKAALQRKMNMVIGAFFSETGRRLLGLLMVFHTDAETIRPSLMVRSDWSDSHFISESKRLRDYQYAIDPTLGDLGKLSDFLTGQRNFLLRLLENPNLLEHETFTDLLWAVFHLTEELELRPDFATLPHSDLAHLGGDIRRAYSLLLAEWLLYVKHLKDDYPYLFSVIIRTNPFDPEASAVVSQP